MVAPSELEDFKDSRKRPDFDILFKQRVGSEDVFLGMSGVTPSSIHCDTILVKVTMPGAQLADVDLDVTEQRITVSSSQYKLATYLPVRVKHKEGNAKWDSAKQVLSVTLPIEPSDFLSGVAGL